MGKSFTFVDLFAGIGGFHLGAAAHGGICITACELNSEGRDIYAANHKVRNNAIHDDIYTLAPIKNTDLVCAGFPCQSHSTLGKRNGLRDKRGKLFVRLCEFIKASQPRAFLLENVKGLMSSTDFEKNIIKPLEDCGYSVSYNILDARNFGVPQHRERVFIVGVRVSRQKTQAINDTPFSFKSLAAQHNHKTIDTILDAKYKDVYESEHLECSIFGV
jgi:DNA (cytosine-5)-methyltransferase 1